jgi:hypothetical protein
LAELNEGDDDGDACPFAVCLLKGFGEELFLLCKQAVSSSAMICSLRER